MEGKTIPAKKTPGIFLKYDLENLENSWNFVPIVMSAYGGVGYETNRFLATLIDTRNGICIAVLWQTTLGQNCHSI